MPKKYRLSGEEMRNISGKRLHGELFSLLVAPTKFPHSKYACVVSKKCSRKAVERNTIERRCKAALAKRMPELKEARALVLYAKPAAKDASYAEVERDIEKLLAKLQR